MSNPDDPRSWFKKVDEDLLTIDNNLAAENVPWMVVGYHAQQAAEKALKGFLVSKGLVAPRIHDMGVLLEQCLKQGAPFEHFRDSCDLLSPLAAANRYPSEDPDPSSDEMMKAVIAARAIAKEIRTLLSL